MSYLSYLPRFNGLPITKPSLPQAEQIEDWMFGILVRSVRSKALRMLRTDLQSYCLCMAVTLPRFPTFHGTPTSPGWLAAFLRITSCRYGRWRRIFTMTRKPKREARITRTQTNLNRTRPEPLLRVLRTIFIFSFLEPMNLCKTRIENYLLF